MRIRKLTVRNFRKFKEQSFFFNPKFTALIGRNASGKTQVLDALSIVLGVYQAKLLNRERIARGIVDAEVRVEERRYVDQDGNEQIRYERRYPVSILADLSYRGEYFTQSCAKKTASGRTTFGGSTQFSQQAQREYARAIEGDEITLPFLGYYGVGRLFYGVDRPRRHKAPGSAPSKKTAGESRTNDSYVDALDPFYCFDDVQKWIKRRDSIRMYKGFDPPLALVYQAMKSTIPGCRDVYYNPEDEKVYLRFNGEPDCPFGNLSDGFRSMVALTSDIARRIAIANPHLGQNALKETEGIALIDELDLYLHPEWQRSVVDALKRTFEKLQFIVTTHSPFIIQSLEPGEVLDLENCDGDVYDDETAIPEGIAWPSADGEYADRSVEDVAEDVMGIPVPQRSRRFQQMCDVAKEYYQLLEREPNGSSEEKARLKQRLDELTRPFAKNPAFVAFLEMERLASSERGGTQ